MIRTTIPLLAALSLAAPAFAESHGGDAEAGADAFSQCQTCHVVVDGDGNTLAGKKAKTGPNLYGVVGSQAGTVEGFRYGKSLVAAGEAGLVWDEEQLAVYLQDPKEFLRTYLDDKKARSKMSFKVRKEEDAANLAAFLATFSPDMEEGMAGDDAAATN
ncbi:MAG: cytochrome C [Rhodobacter sp.]|nr:cytochrome C [Rhodobacter sp.]